MATVYLPEHGGEEVVNKKEAEGPLVMPDGTTSTSNNFGFQMATTSPLVQPWVSSYDGKRPILDVGCAYGINSLAAVRLGAKVVSLDMTELHLHHVAREAKRGGVLRDSVGALCATSGPGVAVVLGALPDRIPLEAGSISSVLVAEVVHFLTGAQIEASFASLHRVLAPGGTLHITALSRASFRRKHTGALIEMLDAQEADPNNKWPGEMHRFGELIRASEAKVRATEPAPLYMDGAFKYAKQELPPLFHAFDPREIARAMEACGFEVVSCCEAEHPGYPIFFREDKNCNVQVIGRKRG